MAMKQFISAVEEIEKEDDEEGLPPGALEFELVKPDYDDPKNEDLWEKRTMVAYRPTSGQLAMLLASTGRHTSVEDQIAGTINFFVATLDPEDADYIERRLLDRRDPGFEIEQVDEIMEWMVEEWGAERPTKRRSGSAGSSPRTGKKSTAAVPA